MMRVRIDTTNFMAAKAVFMRHLKPDLAKSLNKSVYKVVDKAQEMTKFVDPSKINSKLMVSLSPAVRKNGQLSRDKSRQNEVVTPHKWPKYGGNAFVPLAALLVNAQVHSGSNRSGASYINRVTGFRYSRLFSPFKGVSRRTGAAKMTAAISRMVKASRSSTHFMQHSWTSILKILGPLSRGGKASSSHPVDSGFGSVTPAVSGSTLVQCIIENRMGMSGDNAAMDYRRNTAAHRILAPALQKAINSEFERSIRDLDKRGWLKDAPELSRYGFILTV